MNDCEEVIRTSNFKLLVICCAVSYGVVLSLPKEEALVGSASEDTISIQTLIKSVFCLALSTCLYQLLINSPRGEKAIPITLLQIQEFFNESVASEACVTSLKTILPNANEEHIRCQLQELAYDLQLIEYMHDHSLIILSLIRNQIVNHKLQLCVVSQQHKLKEHELD